LKLPVVVNLFTHHTDSTQQRPARMYSNNNCRKLKTFSSYSYTVARLELVLVPSPKEKC